MQTQKIRLGGEILALALVYYIAARFSLLLALPPGYAAPIWPAAGIALAAVLFLGNRVAPGIWLGSFLANAAPAFDAGTALLATSLLVPAGLGAGATLQAIAGAILIRRFVGFPTPLDQERDVLKFLGLGGPVSCVISASAGVTMLFLAGRLSPDTYAFSWWTWWIGDVIGVLVVMPVVLTWFGQPRAIWRRRRITVALPIVLTFAVMLGVYAGGKEPIFAAPNTLVAWFVLAGGMAFTGLLGAFLLVTSGHAMLFEQLAIEEIAELGRKRQAEEALRRERAQMQAIVDNAPMLISIKNVQGETVLANRSILETLDVAPPPPYEDIGRDVADLFPLDSAGQLSADDLAALSSDGPIRTEETIRLKDGTSRTYLSVRFPVRYPDSEEPFGICTISTDITDRKRTERELRQSEAQLRATFEQAAVGIVHISLPERRFLRVNDTFCRMTGYERDELLARTAPDIIHPNDRMIGGEQYQRLMAEDISSFSVVKRYVRKTGQIIWVRATVSAVRHENGDTPYAMDVIEDITDAKLAEQKRHDTERRLALAVHIAQLGFWEWNVETNELYWSPLFKKQLGYEDHELPSQIAEWQ